MIGFSSFTEYATSQLENMSLSELSRLIDGGLIVGRQYFLLYLNKKREYFHTRAGEDWKQAGIMHKVGRHQDPSDMPLHELEKIGMQEARAFKKLANKLPDESSSNECLAKYALSIAQGKIDAAKFVFFEESRKNIMQGVSGWFAMARSLDPNIQIPTGHGE